MILLTRFFFATAKLDGQHQGTTEGGEDSDKGNSDSGGILDGIVNWLSGILAKIKELPALIFDAFKTSLNIVVPIFLRTFLTNLKLVLTKSINGLKKS